MSAVPTSANAVPAGDPGLSNTPYTRIEPSAGWVALRLPDLWQYRELLYFLTWRNVKVRYKQTALGAAWAVLQPLLGMLIFTIFFGRLAKMPSDGIPYPLFSYAGLVPWTAFANALTQSSASLVDNGQVIKKVYFPRLCVPISAVLAVTIDFLIAFTVLLGMMAYYGVQLTANIAWLPLFALLAMITSLGVGFWLSALNVKYRDVRYIVPFLSQLWMFSTPIVYSSSLLPEPWRTIYGLNPMVGVVEGFRWALLGTQTQPGPMVAVSSAAALAVLVSGAFYARRTEKTFADIV